jgi:hypothetical protein
MAVAGLKPDLRINGAVMSYRDLRKGRVLKIGAANHITALAQRPMPHFPWLDSGRKVVRELMNLQAEGRTETLCRMVMPDHLHW